MSLPVVKPECMVVEEDSKPNHHLYPLAGPASAFFSFFFSRFMLEGKYFKTEFHCC